MVKTLISVSWIGIKGYPCGIKRKQSERIKEKSVFTRNNEDALNVVDYPSSLIHDPWHIGKIRGQQDKLRHLSSASLPDAIAMLQSASFSAKTSLTPSPVIATVCPAFLRLRMSTLFCSGVTLPKTVYSDAAFSSISSFRSVPAST